MNLSNVKISSSHPSVRPESGGISGFFESAFVLDTASKAKEHRLTARHSTTMG
jgi:hypothetical protein